MLEFYPQIKLVHISCVLLSGGLFLLRGLLVLSGRPYGNHVALRWLSYTIDTVLLTAALVLVAMLHQYPLQQDWLTVKLVLVAGYIVLGVYALKRAPSTSSRATCFAAALAVYLLVISIARTHDALGVFRFLST